jgi:hypothetical protein
MYEFSTVHYENVGSLAAACTALMHPRLQCTVGFLGQLPLNTYLNCIRRPLPPSYKK